ncbi:DUF4199 domain-containing protein [Pontibacter sp. 172403-2]|uniref:DUF4199 domain-containing protein n=1 Tax=Pontibacter rufus TaxID=2791028 RepID=UPI0018AF918C|nr:DUF4199 domain-containing protein [Pontibacter sp. 172403-2]MBF9254758.1 DUF4199 domain-containing protein [Pontibacter sp. 172403-2]
MAYTKVSFQNLAIKYGLLVGVAHIAYFLLMRILGLIHNIGLSYLSGVFLLIGIVVAISKYKKLQGGMLRYFEGLGIGAITAAVSSLILALFLVLFVTLFDSTYIQALSASGLFPEGLTVLSLFLVTLLEGSVPGFIATFVIMQWFKRQDHSVSNQA